MSYVDPEIALGGIWKGEDIISPTTAELIEQRSGRGYPYMFKSDLYQYYLEDFIRILDEENCIDGNWTLLFYEKEFYVMFQNESDAIMASMLMH